MTASIKVTDNFNRPDGALGGSWGSIVNIGPPNGPANVRITSHAFSPNPPGQLGGQAFALWNGGQTFGNDQYAGAAVQAIQAPLSTVAITAAVQSAGSTTYTYTLTSGAPLMVPQDVLITGMADAGNNSGTGVFVTTGLGAGTFTVANAGGVTRAGQTGVGITPTDAIVGISLRVDGTGQNGYIFLVGTNSGTFSGANDSRQYCREWWKVVGGTFTFLASVTSPPSNIPDVAGDTYGYVITGTKHWFFKNGVNLLPGGALFQTDASVAAGTPGIFTEANGGPNEYTGAATTPTTVYDGYNGTQWTNWAAGDLPSSFTTITSEPFTSGPSVAQLASDSMTYANGDLHTLNPNWVYQTGSVQISSNVAYASANPCYIYRSDVSPLADQYSECKMTVTAVGGTQNGGPSIRQSTSAQTSYWVQVANNLFNLVKTVAGAGTILASNASIPVTGDVVRIYAVGTTIVVTKNGRYAMSAVDSSISSGSPGIACFGNATANGYTNWAGGSVSSLSGNSNFLAGFGLTNGASFFSDTTNGISNLGSANTSESIYDSTAGYTADQFAQSTATSSSFSGLNTEGVAVRISQSQTSCYFFGPYGGGGGVYLFKVINGVGTTLSTTTHTFVAGDVYRLEVVGPMLVAKINGAIVLTAVDFNLTTGNPGMYASSPGNPSAPIGTWSTWTGGNITVSGGVPPGGNVYSQPDSRNYGNFPNLSVNVNGTLTYTKPSVFSLKYWFDTTFSRTQPLPVDSRAAGAPVASGTYPQNSRTPGTFGPGE